MFGIHDSWRKPSNFVRKPIEFNGNFKQYGIPMLLQWQQQTNSIGESVCWQNGILASANLPQRFRNASATNPPKKYKKYINCACYLKMRLMRNATKSGDTVRIASVTTCHELIYWYRPTFGKFNKIQNNFNGIINFLMHKYLALPCKFAKNTYTK